MQWLLQEEEKRRKRKNTFIWTALMDSGERGEAADMF